jgi:hypothetical protein
MLFQSHARGLARVLQILREGVVATLLGDDSQYMNDDVNDLLSQLRGELPESETFSSFSTPTQEVIESEWE